MKRCFRPLRQSMAVTGLIALVAISNLAAQADTLYFHDGHTMKGEIHRITGDIITVKGEWGHDANVHRLSLHNRTDRVKTKNRTYEGELIYIDRFRVELRTRNGIEKISRWKIKEIHLGDPMQTQLVDQHNDAGFRPVHFKPDPAPPLKPLIRRPSEEMRQLLD